MPQSRVSARPLETSSVRNYTLDVTPSSSPQRAVPYASPCLQPHRGPWPVSHPAPPRRVQGEESLLLREQPCRKKEAPVIYRKGLQKAWSGVRLPGGHISRGDLLRDASPPYFLEGTFSSSPRLFGGSSTPGLVPDRAASLCLCVQESGAGTRSLCRVALFPLDVRKRLSAGEEEGTAEGMYSISCCQSLGHAFLTSSPKSSPALSPGPGQAAPSSPSAQK